MVAGSDDWGLKNKVFGSRTGEGDGRIERLRGLGRAERREKMTPIYMSDELLLASAVGIEKILYFGLEFIDRCVIYFH